MSNVLPCKVCAVPLDLFYPNSAMKHTPKSNLLNEIEIQRYSLPRLLGANVTDFMAKVLERLFHVADEIYVIPLSNFRECEVLVVVPD